MNKLCLLTAILISTLTSNAQYVENFDSGSPGWNSYGTSVDGIWEQGTPNYGATSGAFSPPNAWDINLNAAYGPFSYAVLTTPFFDFSSATDAVLSFMINYKTDSLIDGARIDFSSDTGKTWTILGLPGDSNATNWYPQGNIASSGLTAWNGNSNGWVNATFQLSLLNNLVTPVQFRFLFTSDAGGSGDGFSIDNFSIDQVSVLNVATPLAVNIHAVTPAPCTSTVQSIISCYGVADSTVTGNSLSLVLSFGDGTDTAYQAALSGNSFNSIVPHSYATPGNYSIGVIASGGGLADTIIAYNAVNTDTCAGIDGFIYADADSDCLYAANDSLITNHRIKLFKNGILQAMLTGAGYFNFTPVEAGTLYELRIDTSYAGNALAFTCQPGGSMLTSTDSATHNFGVIGNSGYDLSGFLEVATPSQGGLVHLDIIADNLRSTAASGMVKVVLPANTYSSVITFPPATQSGDTLTWIFLQYSAYNYIIEDHHFYADMQLLPSIVAGDSICVALQVYPIAGDQDSSNNSVSVCRVVKPSSSGIEKIVEPNGSVMPGTRLTYTIYFQNNGTDAVNNVTIYDTLSSSLDVTSLELLQASYPIMLQIINGNILKFIFKDINLPTSSNMALQSHGFVSYSINTSAGLAQGTVISNVAYAVLDNQLAIPTAAAVTFIDTITGVDETIAHQLFTVYPNPAYESVTLQSGSATTVLASVFNAAGQLILSRKFIHETVIDTKALPQGFYMIRMDDGKSFMVKKTVIMH